MGSATSVALLQHTKQTETGIPVAPIDSAYVLEWNSATNVLDAVWQTSDLTAQPVCVESNIVASPPLNFYTNNINGLDRGFFWISEEP